MTTPPRQIGFFTATALVVASMIGTGVFTTSGFLLADLKSPWVVLAAWGVGGLVATLGALSYGALARRIPESGGEYLFLSRTLHPAAGYLAGWISFLVGFSAPLAAAALAFGEYTKAWWPGLSPKGIGTMLLLLFSVTHAFKVQAGAWVQNATVAVKLMLIIMFTTLALERLPPPAASLTPAEWEISSFLVGLVWVSFSYSGWNAAIYIGGEVIDPDRNLPRALLAGTLLVTGIYLLLNMVFLLAAPSTALAGHLEVGRIAAYWLGGSQWADALTVLVALALVTSVSSMLMAGPRVYAKMASEGYLPRWLEMTEGPPRAAIAFQALFALVLLWSAAYQSLLTYIGFTLGLSTAGTIVGLMVVRRREGKQFAVPGWPWVPSLFITAVLVMTVFSIARRPVESAAGLGTIALGWVGWRLQYGKRLL